jgi:hypothetical protein
MRILHPEPAQEVGCTEAGMLQARTFEGSSRWGGEWRVVEGPPRGPGVPRSSWLLGGYGDGRPLAMSDEHVVGRVEVTEQRLKRQGIDPRRV